jgi:hypothetical protein
VLNQRSEYTILSLISDVGGLGGSLMGIFAVVSAIFSYQIFIGTVLENLFLIKANVLGKINPDQGQPKANSMRRRSFSVVTKQNTQISEKQLTNMTIDEEERKNYLSLKKDISDREISKESINAIIGSIWNKRAHLGKLISQKSYIYQYFLSLFQCCLKKDKLSLRKAKTYQNSIRKFNKQLDVIELLR